MKTMKINKIIKVQKLQTKNRMVGQTFNPAAHTSESLEQREKIEIDRIQSLSSEEFQKLKNYYDEISKWKEENNIFCSNSFEHNVFIRNFSN